MLSQIRKGKKDDEILRYLHSLTQNRHLLMDEPTVLYGRNIEANNRNREKLNELKGELIVLNGEEIVHKKGLMEQRVKSWKNNLPIPEIIELKVGAKVLFCINKWGKYANGETGVVKRVENNIIVVQKDDGREVSVEKHEFVLNDITTHEESIEEVKLASFMQFPLKLAYAITIHKSQGMSIEKLICDIDNIFEFSQFYVAISRAKNPKNLLIASRNADIVRLLQRCIRIDERVKNFYENQTYIYMEQ